MVSQLALYIYIYIEFYLDKKNFIYLLINSWYHELPKINILFIYFYRKKSNLGLKKKKKRDINTCFVI